MADVALIATTDIHRLGGGLWISARSCGFWRGEIHSLWKNLWITRTGRRVIHRRTGRAANDGPGRRSPDGLVDGDGSGTMTGRTAESGRSRTGRGQSSPHDVNASRVRTVQSHVHVPVDSPRAKEADMGW